MVRSQLGEEEGASLRSDYAWIYAVGARAGARLEEAPEVCHFLETGRAGSLLESLGGRRVLRWSDVPESLRHMEAKARAVEVRARRAHGRRYLQLCAFLRHTSLCVGR